MGKRLYGGENIVVIRLSVIVKNLIKFLKAYEV
jgi:hypothetical protein